MGQQKRRQKNFEKLRGEDAPFLHDARVPHAERGRALRALEEEELPGGEVLVSGGVPGQPGQGRPPVQIDSLGRGHVFRPAGPIPNPV